MSWKHIGPLNPSFNDGSFFEKGTFSPFNWPEPVYLISMHHVNDMLYVFPSNDGFDKHYLKYYIYNVTSQQWYYDIVGNDLNVYFEQPIYGFSSYFDFELNSFYLIGVAGKKLA